MSTWAGRPRLTFTRRYATETKLGGAAVRGLKPIVGEPTIRGLKPTAKFSCRYAAEMRLQPTTNGPRPRVSVPRPMGFRSTAHGFPFHGPRVSVPRRRYPKIHIVMCGQSRHRRVEILPRRVSDG